METYEFCCLNFKNIRFIYGKPDVPKASPEVTSEVYLDLAELQRNEDWDTAVQLVVKAGDPKAQLLAVNDWYRLRRSLEIIKVSLRFYKLHMSNSKFKPGYQTIFKPLPKD